MNYTINMKFIIIFCDFLITKTTLFYDNILIYWFDRQVGHRAHELIN